MLEACSLLEYSKTHIPLQFFEFVALTVHTYFCNAADSVDTCLRRKIMCFCQLMDLTRFY